MCWTGRHGQLYCDAEGRARTSRQYWGLPVGLTTVLAPEKCVLDAYDVIASQQMCGVNAERQGAPVPVFPIPPSSYVARAQQAADVVFAQLKVATEAGEVQLG